MTVVEFQTVNALGSPREIRITKEAHQLYLEIHNRAGLEAMVKLPENFMHRLRMHNLEAGQSAGIIL